MGKGGGSDNDVATRRRRELESRICSGHHREIERVKVRKKKKRENGGGVVYVGMAVIRVCESVRDFLNLSGYFQLGSDGVVIYVLVEMYWNTLCGCCFVSIVGG